MEGEPCCPLQSRKSRAGLNKHIKLIWCSCLDIASKLTSGKLPLHVRSFRYHCVGVGHHGNQHVEEDNDVANRVASKHEQSPKPRIIIIN